jgi:hypothetical protein
VAIQQNIYVSWAPNEKVALEVGIGASIGGARTIVTMKHVGVNVAAKLLLGAFSNTLEPTHEQWIAAIKSLVPARFLDVNLKGFELGCQVR